MSKEKKSGWESAFESFDFIVDILEILSSLLDIFL